jgi:hypothetical protein
MCPVLFDYYIAGVETKEQRDFLIAEGAMKCRAIFLANPCLRMNLKFCWPILL